MNAIRPGQTVGPMVGKPPHGALETPRANVAATADTVDGLAIVEDDGGDPRRRQGRGLPVEAREQEELVTQVHGKSDNAGLSPHCQRVITRMTMPSVAGNIPRMSSDLLTRIDERLKTLGLSDNAACQRAGINRDTIRDLRRHKRQSLTVPTLTKLAGALETTVSWLLTGEDGLVRVPDEVWSPETPEVSQSEQLSVSAVSGRAGVPDDSVPQLDVTAGLGGGGLIQVADSYSEANGAHFAAEVISDYWRLPGAILSRLGARAQHVASFPAQGDSMYPTISDGDVVFVDTRHRVPSPPGIYALTDEFGGLVVKRLEVVSRKSDEEITVRVASDNPKHITRDLPLSEINIVGRYLGKFTTGH